MAISTNGTVLARLAGGLYNTTLSNATYAEVNAVVKTAADINTLANDLYARDFASKTDLSVATTLLSNLGLSSVTGLANWVAAQLTAAGAANKGAKVVSLLNDFANLTSDATYGAAATSFNTKTTAALALSQKDGSAGGDFNVAAAIAAADAAAAAAAAAAKAAADAAAAKAAADAAAAKAAADAAAAAAAVKAAADAAAVQAAADAAAAAKAAAAAAAVEAAAVAAAKAAADAAAAAELAPQTFTLTTGANTFTGKSGADSFDGSLGGAAGSTATFNSFDSLSGGAGTDTLTAQVTGGTTAATLTAIENIIVAASTADATVDLINSTGYTSLENNGSTTGLTFSNVSSATTAFKVSNVSGVSTTFGLTADAKLGTATAATVTLNNAIGSNTVVISGVETLTLNSVGGAANTIGTLTDSSLTKLVFTGSQDLDTGTLPASTATVDASAATGGLTATMGAVAAATVSGGAGDDALTVSAVTGKVSVNAGAGDDTVTAASNLTTTDTLAGGTGDDTLAVAQAGVNSSALSVTDPLTNVSGFETLEITDRLTSAVTTAHVQAGLSSVFLDVGSNGGTLTLEAGAKTVYIATANTGALTVNDTGIATTDSLTVSGYGAIDALNGQALTVAGFETVTLPTGTANKTVGQINITGDFASTGLYTAGTLVVTGSKNLTIAGVNLLSGGTDASTTTGSLNASALTGDLVMSAAGVGTRTITGGSGSDTLVGRAALASNISGATGNDSITGGSNNDTISGGDGNDTISGGGGNDNITAGDGNDIVQSSSSQFTAYLTVDGGVGNDTLYATNNSNFADSTFVGKTSIEKITSAATGLTLSDLGANAAATGIATITFAGTGAIADSATVTSTFTNNLTVNLDAKATGDSNAVVATAYTKNLSVVAADATAVTGATAGSTTITGGTGVADKLTLIAGTYSSANLANISAIENIVISDDNAATLVLASGNAVSGQTLTVDGSAIASTGNVFGVNAGNITAGSVVVIGGNGADSITGSASTTSGDSLSGGAGSDTFYFGTANLTSSDTIVGGTGTNVIGLLDGTNAITDTVFTNATAVQSLSYSTFSPTITLGAAAAAAGIVTVTDGTGNATINLGAGYTNNVTVALSSGTDSVAASTYTKNISATVTAANLIAATKTLTAGTGTDTLTMTFVSGNQVASSDMSAITGFESFKSASNVAANIIFNDANIASGASATIDFSANTTNAATISAANETNGSVTIITSGANDVITASQSTYGDNISTGAGDDSVTVAITQLLATDTINGGAGNDTLTFSAAGAIGDSAFTNVSGFEYLQLANGTNTLVVGSAFQAAGATTIIGGTGADSITIGVGETSNVRVKLGDTAGGSDSVAATGYTGNLTVSIDGASLSSGDTLTGGSGSDTLLVTFAGETLAAADVLNITKFETIKTATDGVGTVTLSDANFAATAFTVNAVLNTSATFTLNASAEDDSTMTYIGGNGRNVVTGTTLADSITGGDLNDSLVGGAGNDTISGGAHNDTITGGAGADVISGGSGNDVFFYTGAGFETGSVSPAVIYWGGSVDAGTSVSTAAMDKITDFAAGDSVVTSAGGSATSTVNGVGLAWTAYSGFLKGTYSATAQTFVFSTTGTDTLFAYDFDGLDTTNDIRGVVLVGYVDSGTADTMTSGLVGVA